MKEVHGLGLGELVGNSLVAWFVAGRDCLSALQLCVQTTVLHRGAHLPHLVFRSSRKADAF